MSRSIENDRIWQEMTVFLNFTKERTNVGDVSIRNGSTVSRRNDYEIAVAQNCREATRSEFIAARTIYLNFRCETALWILRRDSPRRISGPAFRFQSAVSAGRKATVLRATSRRSAVSILVIAAITTESVCGLCREISSNLEVARPPEFSWQLIYRRRVLFLSRARAFHPPLTFIVAMIVDPRRSQQF